MIANVFSDFKSMITMTALAEKAGVSRATVSHVLHERATSLRISETTRNRVLEVAAQEGFRRNELFRSAVSGKSYMIGFLVKSPRPEPVARILDGAVSAAETPGYTVKVLKVPENRLEKGLIDRCIQLRLAALVTLYLPAADLEVLHRELAVYQIPLAVVDTHTPLDWGVRIEADDTQALALAVEHLTQLGHRKIGFLSGVPGALMSVQRETAFRAAMKRFGLKSGPVAHGFLEAETMLEAARHLLQHEKPTAIIGLTDPAAMTVLRAARSLNLEVPRDLSVVGYGGMSLAEFSDPPLTTVVQPFEEIGQAAIEQLLQRVHNCATDFEDSPHQAALPARLWVRESTGLVPQNK